MFNSRHILFYLLNYFFSLKIKRELSLYFIKKLNFSELLFVPKFTSPNCADLRECISFQYAFGFFLSIKLFVVIKKKNVFDKYKD